MWPKDTKPITESYQTISIFELSKSSMFREREITRHTLRLGDIEMVLVKDRGAAKAQNPAFEPAKSEADKDETEVFTSVRPALLPLLSAFRTVDWKAIKLEMEMSGFWQLCATERQMA